MDPQGMTNFPAKFIALTACLWFTGCSPVYTWGYAPTIHPKATSAYIHAVMAREAGDYELALEYYNEALRHTNSDAVRAERDEIKQFIK